MERDCKLQEKKRNLGTKNKKIIGYAVITGAIQTFRALGCFWESYALSLEGGECVMNMRMCGIS